MQFYWLTLNWGKTEMQFDWLILFWRKSEKAIREGFIKKKNKIGGIFQQIYFFWTKKKSVSQTTPNGLKHENNQ